MYKILEAHIEYRGDKLHRVTVLVEISAGDIRAITSSEARVSGYDSVKPDEPVNNKLLQRVAGYGMRADDGKTIFPNWRKYF